MIRLRRNLTLPVFFLFLFVASPVHAQGDPLQGLDAYIRKSMADWQIPGLAVAVVKDDKVVFIRAYGTRQIGREAPVDVHTIFPLDSMTKGFTALAVAMLVDEGKLSWDDPVSRHLPWLEFADPWVTGNVTVRDLLSQRVAGGWGGSSYPFDAGGFRADEILRRMRYLGGSGAGFRSGFVYDNINYEAAGELVAAVSAMPWLDFVRSRILKPLGMRSALTNVLWDERAIARCFECGLEGHTVSLEDASVENIAVLHYLGDAGPETWQAWRGKDSPASGITADIDDVAKWLRFQLGKGSFEGKRLLRPETFEQIHRPQISIPAGWLQEDLRPGSGNFMAYGFGWFLTDYRGRKGVMHGGGWHSYMAMLPEEDLGVAVLANLWPNQFRQALIFRIFDAYLGAPERDWSKELLEKANAQRERRRAQREKVAAERPPGGQPSLPPSGYVGSYTHRAYGVVTVTQENDRLVVRFPRGQIGDLEYWQDDKFRVNWRGPFHFQSLGTFTPSPQGHANSLRLDYPGAEFTRVPEPDN